MKANFMIDKNGRRCLFVTQSWWTEEEKEAFAQAVRQYGQDYISIQSAIKTKTLKQIQHYARDLLKRITKDRTHKDADILKIYKFRENWTIEEKSKFIEIVEKHGKDYNILAKHIKTKTRE